MTGVGNTLFIRLEGPLQAWGDNSKSIMRRSMRAPTKSGVIGIICSAMGLDRRSAGSELDGLSKKLKMGVRIDRPGIRWWDYHTVGAKIGIVQAKDGGIKKTHKTGEIEPLVSRREYLCDASFLVAIQGDNQVMNIVYEALIKPRRPIYLGRKSCPPCIPIIIENRSNEKDIVTGDFTDLQSALQTKEWRPRYREDAQRNESGRRLKKIKLECILDRCGYFEHLGPMEEEVWYDMPISFDPPVHGPRLVQRKTITVDIGEELYQRKKAPPRLRANYENSVYKTRRQDRLSQEDHYLCVFCKELAKDVHHITYRRAGGNEDIDDLRSLCRLCHDAITMLEYGLGMGLDRINPEEPRWRDMIIDKRDEIVRFRSLETRRRRLKPEEVE